MKAWQVVAVPPGVLFSLQKAETLSFTWAGPEDVMLGELIKHERQISHVPVHMRKLNTAQ